MNLPIESIFGAIQFFISVFIAYNLYKSTKRRPNNINIKYFFYTFILLSVVFAFSAISIVSTINFKTDFLISSVNIIGRGFILLGVMFFAYIPLNILKGKLWKLILPFLVLIVAVLSNLFSMMSLFNHPRTPVESIGSFIIRTHRSDMYTNVGIAVIGVTAIFCLILASYKHMKVIYQDIDDPYVFKRGLLTIGAALFFAIGIGFNYLLTLAYPVVGRVISEILYLIALVFFLISVLYKKKGSSLATDV
ncbi:MAG: hypothetical protein ACOCRX_09855 [Candidatus Woesearchaeota archaeon]